MEEKCNARQAIIENALELFSAKGYEGVSVSEITEASGITKPTLYYYFASKEGLFESVCELYYAKLDRLIGESAEYNARPHEYDNDIYFTLSKVVAAYFSFARENESFFRIVLSNWSMPPSSAVFGIAGKYHFRQFDIIKNMFHSMSRAHGNLKGKKGTLTWSFIGTVNSYIGLYFSGAGGGEPFPAENAGHGRSGGLKLNDKAIKELVRQFMHGIFA